jgi:RIO kinase 1
MSAAGPVIIDFPQSVDAASNLNARKLLLRDVDNLKRFLRKFAPDLRPGPFAEEMWDLYATSLLTPETRLTGRHRASERRANTAAVLDLIGDANDDERKRRQRQGLGMRGVPSSAGQPPEGDPPRQQHQGPRPQQQHQGPRPQQQHQGPRPQQQHQGPRPQQQHQGPRPQQQHQGPRPLPQPQQQRAGQHPRQHQDHRAPEHLPRSPRHPIDPHVEGRVPQAPQAAPPHESQPAPPRRRVVISVDTSQRRPGSRRAP